MSVVNSHFSAPSIKTDKADRRRGQRQACVCHAWVQSPTDFSQAHRIEVGGVNVSRHGVAFEIDRPLAVDSYMKIELEIAAQRIVSEVRIIHCEPAENDLFHIGAEFC